LGVYINIAVIGVGYVGLCSAVGLALAGHNVIAVGRTPSKVDSINNGKSPIFEEGLDESLAKIIADKKFSATTDIADAVSKSDITFICVGTPSAKDGSIDLTDIKNASESVGKALKDKKDYHVVVVKSTVVPGTTETVSLPIIEEHSGKKAGQDFGVGMNPEFLREGKALEDFMKPDRVVLGQLDDKSGEILQGIYSSFGSPILRVPLKTAEMIKYANNSFHALKVAFTNELAAICKKKRIDSYVLMDLFCKDTQLNISPYYMTPGKAYDGRCLPKDLAVLQKKGKELRKF